MSGRGQVKKSRCPRLEWYNDKPLIVLRVFYSSAGVHTVSTGHIATGQQGVRYLSTSAVQGPTTHASVQAGPAEASRDATPTPSTPPSSPADRGDRLRRGAAPAAAGAAGGQGPV